MLRIRGPKDHIYNHREVDRICMGYTKNMPSFAHNILSTPGWLYTGIVHSGPGGVAEPWFAGSLCLFVYPLSKLGSPFRDLNEIIPLGSSESAESAEMVIIPVEPKSRFTSREASGACLHGQPVSCET